MATLSGVWVFNETISIPKFLATYTNLLVNFTSNATKYYAFYHNGSEIGYSLSTVYASGHTAYVLYNTTPWNNEAYRTVDFGTDEQTVSDEFYTWFTTNAVGETAEEPETVTQYLIRSDTLTAIADRTREMAGTNKKMTPADIIYWLGRVKFIPQGWATSEFTLDFDSGASGVLPVVVKGTASSEFTLNFESSAVGALQEG